MRATQPVKIGVGWSDYQREQAGYALRCMAIATGREQTKNAIEAREASKRDHDPYGEEVEYNQE